MKDLFIQHLAEIESWLREAPHIEVIYVNYGRVIAEPHAQANRINRFLGGGLDLARMTSAVDAKLYRNRA